MSFCYSTTKNDIFQSRNLTEGLYMFCKNCGKELLEGAAFCHGCGAAAPAPNTESEKPEATCNTTEEKVTYTAPETNKETVPPIYQIPQYTAPAEEN